jgi:hypothetical protein
VLARQRERERKAREAAEAKEFAAAIEQGRRVLAWCRAELEEVKTELARRKAARQEESKYSPSQLRVPAGNPRGGQWTDRSGGGGGLGSGGLASADNGSAEDVGNSGSPEDSNGLGITDPRVISDADPEGVKPGEQYAQAGDDAAAPLIPRQRPEILSPIIKFRMR